MLRLRVDKLCMSLIKYRHIYQKKTPMFLMFLLELYFGFIPDLPRLNKITKNVISIVHTKRCGGFTNWSKSQLKKCLLLEINTITKFLLLWMVFIWLLIHVMTLLSQCVNELIYYLITYVISFYQLNCFLMFSENFREYREY